MSREPSFTLFTYSHCTEPNEARWADTGIPRIFFDTFDEARSAVLELRAEMVTESGERWPAACIEKIETLPVSKVTLLALLNGGVGAFLGSWEIVETIA